MNDQIINNLYEFWRHIGLLNSSLIETDRYSAVLITNSEWPNRIFDVRLSARVFDELKTRSLNHELPGKITVPKSCHLHDAHDYAFAFGQKNMALDWCSAEAKASPDPNIKRVMTENESIEFANTASESFGYLVGKKTVSEIVRKSKQARLFIYREGLACLGCGIVFLDSNNYAGLHMIGTLPNSRGAGIGKRMTLHLLREAKEIQAKACVLHASLLGEPIYAKLGFKVYGEMETYCMLKTRNDEG